MTRSTALLISMLIFGCTRKTDDTASETDEPEPSACATETGCLLAEELAYGLLSVQVVAEDDVWIVGSSPEPADGTGPAILHYTGDSWTRLDTSEWAGSEIWWAWIHEDEAVFVGNNGLILEWSLSEERFEQIDGPPDGVTFFGVWGAHTDDVWAVGMSDGGEGPRAVWRRTNGTWAAWEDPDLGAGDNGVTYFKVHGTSADDVWMVGTGGQALHWDGSSLQSIATDTDTPTSTAPLLTVDADPDYPVAVGGAGNGLLLEYDGTAWRNKSPEFQPGLNGVCSGAGQQWAVGQHGSRSRRNDDGSWSSDMDFMYSPPTYEDWHGCDVAPNGDLWTVGGRIASRPLTSGVIGFQGNVLPSPLPE